MGADLVAPGTLPALFDDAATAASADEIAWYAARLPRQGNVLDLACRAGRLLVPLAGARAMHGIDASAAALSRCHARLALAGAHATLVHQDMGMLNLPFRFTAAYAAAGAFQRLADPRVARDALARIRAHLVPPGLVVLELVVPSASTQRLAAPLVEVRTQRLADGSSIALRSETITDADARIARSERRYVHRRGTARLAEERDTATITWYERDDIVSLLAASAFDDVRIEPAPHASGDADAFMVLAHAA